MRVFASIAFVLTLAASSPGQEGRHSMRRMDWAIDGLKREALVFFPIDAQRPSPVVFMFHGHGGNMQGVARRMALEKHWPAAIVVYPQGIPTPTRLDPQGQRAGWQTDPGGQNNRDVRFVDAILGTLRSESKIDAERIYATGFSNGGGFTYLLWKERPRVFAAFAPSGAILRHPQDIVPRPVLHIAGQIDNVAKFASQLRTMELVRSINDCRNQPVEWAPLCQLYPPQSERGAPFVSMIHPGGHIIPADAPALIVRFFKSHARRG